MRSDIFLCFPFIRVHSGIEDGLKVGIGSGGGWSLRHKDCVRELVIDEGDMRAACW